MYFQVHNGFFSGFVVGSDRDELGGKCVGRVRFGCVFVTESVYLLLTEFQAVVQCLKFRVELYECNYNVKSGKFIFR